MARLYRPYISLAVRITVLHRHLGQEWGHYYVTTETLLCCLYPRRDLFRRMMVDWAARLGCEVKDLRLDHDPPLAARERTGEGNLTTYVPDANDPEHLFYRPHGARFAGSHDVKTRIRGDHGQHPDRVLIKKMRRIERGPRPKRQPGFKTKAPKRRWPSRPFPSKGRKR